MWTKLLELILWLFRKIFKRPKPVPKAPEEPSIVVLERTPPSASASVLRSRTQQLEQQAKEALKDVQTQHNHQRRPRTTRRADVR